MNASFERFGISEFVIIMKRLFVNIIIVYAFFINANAISVDSISTTYNDGIFNTQYLTKTKVSGEIVNSVTNDLVSDFHNSSSELFNWALKDLGLQNEGNELIIILKSSFHDVKTNITHGLFDIEVPYFKTFSDVKVNAIVSKSLNNGVTKVNANIIYSSLLLDNCQATLYIIPQKNKELYLYTNVKIKFGWFFNIFITKRRYKSIVEWRVKQFAKNMKEECELRQNKIITY